MTYNGTNPWIDALYTGGGWVTNTGTVTIRYTEMSGSDPNGVNGIASGQTWTAAESAALAAALATWEAVANIEFVKTNNQNTADAWYWLGTTAEVGALAWHSLPMENGFYPLYGAFATNATGWTTQGLQAGGYGFLTLVHELGHGLGLSHPHDGNAQFPGVTDPFNDYGLYDLNQGIYTVMTYNDGWATEYPNHFSEVYGYAATPMALDIAAIQEMYGANMSYNTGDDVYYLPDANAAGTFWACIWDAGGTDTISAEGSSRDFIINLNDAPLTGENAGGFVSYSQGIVGGYTIANTVTIENAIGGDGDDDITGNEAANTLMGGGGDDTLRGGAGDDTLEGGAGADYHVGGNGIDTVSYENSTSRVWFDLQNNAFFLGDAVGDTYSGIEIFRTGNTADQLRGDSDSNTFYGGGLSDRLYGRGGDDILYGEGGADALYGNAGVDTMTGGDDDRRDRFIYFNISESGVGTGNRDVITDFESGEDRIEISRFDADTTTGGNQAFTFIGDTGFSGTAGELRYTSAHGITVIQADVDGDGAADFEIELTGEMDLLASDFLL